MKGRIYIFFQFCYVIGIRFSSHQGPLRATALTYTTALSLVPFLAIAFSVLKGLGAQNALEPLLGEMAGDSQAIVTRVVAYVNNTNVKSLGAVGLLALVLTAISMMQSIEMAFNTICGVQETRTLKRRFSDYLSVIVVGPILLLVATSITSSMQSQWLVQWLIQRSYVGDAILFLFRLAPYVSVWIATTFLYLFIPNTRIRLSSAVLGGILAGTAWEIAQWAYFHFQIGVANYNAIYGTMAALPVFLVWVYVSWLIVLFGLEIVYAHQHRHEPPADIFPPAPLDPAAYEELALAILVQICRHFQKGENPPDAAALAEEMGTPLPRVEEALDILVQRGHITATAGAEPGWLPSREPSEVKVADVLASLRGIPEPKDITSPALAIAGKVMRRSWDSTRNSLEGLTLHDLVLEHVPKE